MKQSLLFLVLVLLFSCQSLPSQIGNINLQKWKEDKNACFGYRKENIENLQLLKNELLRLSEADILSMLGKPESTELIEKSQKIYVYHLESNDLCLSAKDTTTTIKTFLVRFNSTGYCSGLIINVKKKSGSNN